MEEVSDDDIMIANERGYIDFSNGLALEENPYRHPILYKAWADGHEKAYQYTYEQFKRS